MDQETIGSVNTAYLGAILLLLAVVAGCVFGGLTVYAFMH